MNFEDYVCSGFLLLVLSLVVGMTVYNLDTNSKMAEAIAKGNDPIAVLCAFNYDRSKAVLCNNVKKGN